VSNDRLHARVKAELDELKSEGRYKVFRALRSPMGPVVDIEGAGETVMLCSNDYLGLANHPDVVAASKRALDDYGAGTASVRFITGTFAPHDALESKLAQFSHTEAALSYVSAWTANEAVFPTLVGPNDAILSDALNHASLIDSIRQTKGAAREVYAHGDLSQLEHLLQKHRDAEVRWVVTDGVFSMEGDVADLDGLVRLCEQYAAILVVDDSHGVGVLGATGKGTAEHCDVLGRIDVLTGTLGKALGGAAGGYVATSRDVIDVLRQRGRPSLFSNALPVAVACGAAAAIDVLQREPQRLQRLHQNVARLRDGLSALGFDCRPSPSAIIPIIVGETEVAIAKSARLLQLGVMVIGFGYPVVPKGEARLRIQVSASLEDAHIDKALTAFSQL
jgi:glycine C-acetyltransferase